MIIPRPLRKPPVRIARKITRAPSPAFAYFVPWGSVMLASLLPGWLAIAMKPWLPPLGFLTLLAWRQLRPGLLPVWSGFLLGLFDDLFSGQPFGSAMMLWSVAMLSLDIIEAHFPWRNFLIEWSVASVIIAIYVPLTGLIASAGTGTGPPAAGWVVLLAPQLLVAVVIYPAVGRIVARLDRFRLTRFRVFS